MTIDFKERKKEIIVCSVYIVVFLMLFIIINSLNSTKAELEAEEESLSYVYNNLINNTKTVEQLNTEYDQLEIKLGELNAKLPMGLDNLRISSVVTEIANKNSELLQKNYTIDEAKKMTGDFEGLEYVKVTVKNYSGSQESIKKFLEYISTYDVKADVGELTIKNSGTVTGSLDFNLYARSEVQE